MRARSSVVRRQAVWSGIVEFLLFVRLGRLGAEQAAELGRRVLEAGWDPGGEESGVDGRGDGRVDVRLRCQWRTRVLTRCSGSGWLSSVVSRTLPWIGMPVP